MNEATTTLTRAATLSFAAVAANFGPSTTAPLWRM